MTGQTNWMTHARSLASFAVLIAVAGALGNVVELLLVDFIYGNPHRTQENALEMMALSTPVMGLVAFAFAFCAYAVPQLFQATVSLGLAACCGTSLQAGILLALPLTAFITCFWIFHVTVPLFDTFSLERGSYPYWLTAANDLRAVMMQAPVTVFSAAYTAFRSGRLRWKPVIGSAVVLAIIAGVAWGSDRASQQFQFL